jgi:hypothetical protein
VVEFESIGFNVLNLFFVDNNWFELLNCKPPHTKIHKLDYNVPTLQLWLYAWPVRMPLRTSRISRPPLVGQKLVRKQKKKEKNYETNQ